MTETKKKQIDDIRLKAQLNNSQQQKGVSWRKEKLEAVAKARRNGYSEKAIFIELKKAGLVNHTVNTIMEDAWYCDGTESDNESFMDYAKRREKEKKEQK